jgi:hypothetical protein
MLSSFISDFHFITHNILSKGNIVNCFCKSKSTHKLAGPYGQEYAFLFQFKVDAADTLCHAAFEVTANFMINSSRVPF